MGTESAGLECDLVMEGGVTSGIVYPPAVLELCKHYRFRHIGGASAGAIAAGVTAAAQYGKDRDGGGFDRLDKINKELGTSGKLWSLFRPAASTRPLFTTFRVLMMPLVSKAIPILRFLLLVCVFAIILSAIAGPFRHSLPSTAERELLGVAAWIMIVIAAVAIFLVICALRMPSQGFGICLGHEPGAVPSNAGYLTDWMTWAVEYLAGRCDDPDLTDKPLTFGDLKNQGEHWVQLHMVTSNISQGIPFGIPFRDTGFLFNETEWRRLFPGCVVDSLITASKKNFPAAYGEEQSIDDEPDHIPDVIRLEGSGYYLMPKADDWPVVVGMRLSLSFPILVCAVPFYSLSLNALAQGYSRTNPLKIDGANGVDPAEVLLKNWFSDGGLCSNFPVHFFDGWLPERPTFGIQLLSLPDDSFEKGAHKTSYLSAPIQHTRRGQGISQRAGAAERRYKQAATDTDNVSLPQAQDDIAPDWTNVKGLGGFLAAVFFTAKDWQDTLLALQPSYRERVARVRLADSEGGLHLGMRDELVQDVMNKGKIAGTLLVDNYAKASGLKYHEWTRFLVVMAQLEDKLTDLFPNGSGYYKNLLAAQANPGSNFPYTQPLIVPKAQAAIDALDVLSSSWPSNTFGDISPLPEPTLRITPNV